MKVNRLLFIISCVLFLLAAFFVIFDVHNARAESLFLYFGLASLAGGFIT